MKKKCRYCGKVFDGDNSRRKFCSLECCWDYRSENGGKGQFKKGFVPWNTGTKGVMKANSGSFKQGMKPLTKCDIGTETLRWDKSGKQRVWVKIADNGDVYDWKLRAVLVWEECHGPIANGLIVHHKNGNTLDDSLGNLEAMTRSEHLLIHRSEFEDKRRKAVGEAARRRHARNRIKRKRAKRVT